MKLHKNLARLLCFVLVLMLTLALAGCQKNETAPTEENADTPQASHVGTEGNLIYDDEESPASGGDLGTGETEPASGGDLQENNVEFTFNVTMPDGTETSHSVKTSASTVGDALVEAGLIEGNESEYGLYVTTVDGCTLDWDTDHAYWAFYINGEYAMTGVDATPIVEGETYAFVATPG